MSSTDLEISLPQTVTGCDFSWDFIEPQNVLVGVFKLAKNIAQILFMLELRIWLASRLLLWMHKEGVLDFSGLL